MEIIRTEKTRFTRMCIGEAVIELLKTNPLKQLRISAVVHKAGVSRMTFYKHYVSLQSALEDYLHMIIADYLQQGMADMTQHVFLTYEHILFSMKYFDRYRDFFLTMKQRGLYVVMIDSVNEFIAKHIHFSSAVSVYKQYSYAGSLLNCFIMWEENGRKEPVEDVARTIYQLYGEN